MRGTLSLALSEEDGAVSLIAMSMFIFSYPLSLSPQWDTVEPTLAAITRLLTWVMGFCRRFCHNDHRSPSLACSFGPPFVLPALDTKCSPVSLPFPF